MTNNGVGDIQKKRSEALNAPVGTDTRQKGQLSVDMSPVEDGERSIECWSVVPEPSGEHTDCNHGGISGNRFQSHRSGNGGENWIDGDAIERPSRMSDRHLRVSTIIWHHPVIIPLEEIPIIAKQTDRREPRREF